MKPYFQIAGERSVRTAGLTSQVSSRNKGMKEDSLQTACSGPAWPGPCCQPVGYHLSDKQDDKTLVDQSSLQEECCQCHLTSLPQLVSTVLCLPLLEGH